MKVAKVVFAPDGQRILGIDHRSREMAVWDSESVKLLQELNSGGGGKDAVRDAAFVGSNRIVAARWSDLCSVDPVSGNWTTIQSLALADRIDRVDPKLATCIGGRHPRMPAFVGRRQGDAIDAFDDEFVHE